MERIPHTEAYEDGHCKDCGAKYHCGQCGVGTGMYGHLASDARGSYYTCQEPNRVKFNADIRRGVQEANERAELRRLLAKYPDEVTR